MNAMPIPNLEGIIGPFNHDYLTPARDEWIRHKQNTSRSEKDAWGYGTTNRHLLFTEQSRDERVSYDGTSYVGYLPTFQGKDFIEHLRSIDHPKYLDIGFGAGVALIELSDLFSKEGHDISITGVGNDNFTKFVTAYPEYTRFGPTAPMLAQRGITIYDENIIDTTLPANSFDVITSVQGLNWVKFPKWELLKIVNHLLKPGGIAFLSPYAIRYEDKSKGSLVRELNSRGYAFELGDRRIDRTDEEYTLAFQKTHDQLPEDLTFFEYPSGGTYDDSTNGFVMQRPQIVVEEEPVVALEEPKPIVNKPRFPFFRR